jgi:hypothetical protein
LNIHKNELEKLLKQKSKFWKIRDFDGEIHKKCTNISHTGKTVIRYYYCLVASGCIFFDIQPFSTGALPTACYVPQGYFTALTVVLWYLSLVVALCIPGTDGFFCSLGTSLIVQFELLSHKFETMKLFKNEEKMWRELKELVNYHNFLLRYLITPFRLSFQQNF